MLCHALQLAPAVQLLCLSYVLGQSRRGRTSYLGAIASCAHRAGRTRAYALMDCVVWLRVWVTGQCIFLWPTLGMPLSFCDALAIIDP